MKNLILAVLSFCSSGFSNSVEDAFTRIYRNGEWGKNEEGEGTSGTGSTVNLAGPYLHFLNKFLSEHPEILRVIDLGCGDWVLGREIFWGERDYIGIDVVKFLVEKNQSRYGSERKKFIHLDATKKILPEGDLLICKDVLQHLPFSSVQFILSQMKKFRYCIFVNDVTEDLFEKNYDIKPGGYRTLNLTLKPFYLKPIKKLIYKSGVEKKQILVIEN